MIKNIPKEILDRFNNVLDSDVFEIKAKTHQIYVKDIVERIYCGNLVQFIRINTYTDGKIIIGENTREVIARCKSLMLRKNILMEIPVTYITWWEDRICLFIDTEYLEKTGLMDEILSIRKRDKEKEYLEDRRHNFENTQENIGNKYMYI